MNGAMTTTLTANMDSPEIEQMVLLFMHGHILPCPVQLILVLISDRVLVIKITAHNLK